MIPGMRFHLRLLTVRMAALIGAASVAAASLIAAEGDAPKTQPDPLAEKLAALEKKADEAGESGGEAAFEKVFEEGLRALIAEFPGRPEPWNQLVYLSVNATPERTRALAAEVLASPASDKAKSVARAQIEILDRVGKPLTLTFTALDGSYFDLASLHGKVVLIDFWATWCGPCVRAMPEIQQVYAAQHAAGLEIVGISLDRSREKLEAFLAKEQMPWVQSFSGKAWDDDLARGFGIYSIPTQWLVDKKGVLRDVRAGEKLADKVAALLAE
jgi:thiol-disulfide isomerase/thioredoxin